MHVHISHKTRNVGQCPRWWSPCWTQVAPSVQRCRFWLTLTTWLPCSNAAKTRNLLKLAGVPQTTGSISAISGRCSSYCGDILRTYCCFTSFFLIVDMCLGCEDIAQQSCAMVRWCPDGDFWRLSCFLYLQRVQHISDLHSKFALRPHHVWKYGRHPLCDRWD